MSLFSVYVAGASATTEIDAPKWAMESLKAEDVEVSHNWIEIIKLEGSANDLSNDIARHCANADLQGVRDADVVWILTPAERGAGSGYWVELGAALAMGKTVVVSGPQYSRSIFASLGAQFLDHDAALAFVLKLRRSRNR